jgi:cell division protein FtsZ
MLFEVDEAVNRIRAEVDCDANILFGSALLENMEGKVRVSVVATGIDAESCTGYVAENVQRLHVPRRRTVESDAPAAVATTVSPRMSYESPATRMVDNHNLAVQLDTLQMMAPVQEHVIRKDPAPVIPVPPPRVQMEEPLDLGGANAPIIQDAVSRAIPARAEARPAPAAPPQKRRLFGGLFGGRRPEYEAQPIEPRFEPPMQAAPRQQATAPRAQAPAQAAPQAPQSAPARATAEQPRPQNPSPDDLFAGVAEDDRFEIPAFLRRQGNTGG